MEPTKHISENPGLDRPATYQIKVQGRLDERWLEWFEGMAITVQSKSRRADQMDELERRKRDVLQ